MGLKQIINDRIRGNEERPRRSGCWIRETRCWNMVVNNGKNRLRGHFYRRRRRKIKGGEKQNKRKKEAQR